MDVVRRGLLIGSATKLGSGSGGVLARRKLNGSLALPITTTRVVRAPQLVFTNPIMIIRVNRIIDQPLMSSMVARGYRNEDATNPRRGYQKPFAVTTPILDHKYDHYVKPNKVAFKHLDFKKDVDPNVHVRVFNFVIKKNVKTSKKYIINAFSYTLKDTSSN
jgi:hypothetical protein